MYSHNHLHKLEKYINKTILNLDLETDLIEHQTRSFRSDRKFLYKVSAIYAKSGFKVLNDCLSA